MQSRRFLENVEYNFFIQDEPTDTQLDVRIGFGCGN